MKEASLEPVFVGIDNLPPDNGEVFLSEYYYEQNERNQQNPRLFDIKNNKCNCPKCESVHFPLVKASRATPAMAPAQGVKRSVQIIPPQVVQTPTTPALLKVAPIAVQGNQNLEHTTAHNPVEMFRNPMMALPPLRHVAQQPVTIQQPVPLQSQVNSPFFASTNYFSHLSHAKLPPQCCCAYPPYYCPARLTWMSQGGPTFWPHPPPPHNKGCPAWRPRGPVASPFLHMKK